MGNDRPDFTNSVDVHDGAIATAPEKPNFSNSTDVPKEEGPSVLSRVVRGVMSNTPFDAMEKSDWIEKHKADFPKDKPFFQAYNEFIKPYEDMKRNETWEQQLQGPMIAGAAVGAAVDLPLTAVGVGASIAWGHLFDARKFAAEHGADKNIQDLATIGEWGLFGGVMGTGAAVVKGFKAFPNPEIHDLAPEHITDIQHNLNLTKAEQNTVFGTLGINPNHIAVAKDKNMSLKVRMDRIEKLTKNQALWDKVKGVFTKETVDGEAPKIKNAALMINGQLRVGPNHPQILADAVKEGLISEADAKKYDIEKNGMFTTNLKGRAPLTRAQAKREFDIDHSEQIPEQQYKFVKNDPFSVRFGRSMKLTGRYIREDFSGLKNLQITIGNQLRDTLKRIVPDEMQRRGIFWYKSAKGDMNVIAKWLEDPDFEPYRMEIANAVNMSDKQMEALGMIEQYYDEAGRVALSTGTVKDIRDNYQNRMTVKKFDIDEETGKRTPVDEPKKTKTEINKGLSDFTKHKLGRVFETEEDVVKAGYGFQTTDVADSLAIYNEEMAKTNATKKLYGALEQAKIGARRRTNNVPKDYSIVPGSEKDIPIKDEEGKAVIGKDGNQVVAKTGFAAPKEFVKAIQALTEPNKVKQIDWLRNLQGYQGLVKTVDLAYSFFHHFSMAAQTCYQGGIPALMNAGKMGEIFATKPFQEIEQDFVEHTGMTSKIEQNKDILRNILDLESKQIKDNPVLNAAFKGAHRNTEFLFGKFQRFLKISDYGSKLSKWIGDHPAATDEEIKVAKTEIAKQINTVYGGLNWEAMGFTRNHVALLRLGLLAPDWTISNVQLLKQAIGEKGLAGNLSRVHVLTALAGGMMLTEGLNKMTTGHYTDENEKGHFLEWQVAPDVYVSFLRGGIGDISKFVSMWMESGPAGASRFAQGKLAPLPRVFTGLASGVQYSGGREIMGPKEGMMYGTAHYLAYILANGGPMPFSASNFGNYLKDEPDKTFWGGAAVLSGLGRYSRPPSAKRKPVERRSVAEESEMVGDKFNELWGKVTGKDNE